MAQNVTKTPFGVMKPDSYTRADEFSEFRLELCRLETTINPPLNLDYL
jgi:hypothetical protein